MNTTNKTIRVAIACVLAIALALIAVPSQALAEDPESPVIELTEAQKTVSVEATDNEAAEGDAEDNDDIADDADSVENRRGMTGEDVTAIAEDYESAAAGDVGDNVSEPEEAMGVPTVDEVDETVPTEEIDRVHDDGVADTVSLEDSEADEDLLLPAANSGMWGTCRWEMDSKGVLRIHAGIGDDTGSWDKPWGDNSKIEEVVFDKGVILPEYCVNMFFGGTRIKRVVDNGVDTSIVRDMSYMFMGCTSLTSINLSGWDTSSVTYMESMFEGCSSLTSLNLSGWDTSRVDGMSGMFARCSSLKSLNLSGWDVSSAEFMGGMFSYCSALTSLNVSGWKTPNYHDMNRLFFGCSSLVFLDLSSWRISSSYTEHMFSGCTSLSRIKISAVFKSFSADVFPYPLGSKTEKWRSVKDGGIYTRDDIIDKRSGIADTYVAEHPFPDVKKDAWFYQVVNRAAALNLVGGYSDGRFAPYDSITRGQVVVILWRMANQPKPSAGTKSFPDVKNSSYYYNAVQWASSIGVVSGYENGTFGPDKNVTREQLAVMLANYARKVGGIKVAGSKSDYSKMSDANSVANYAQAAVGWCFRTKMLSGAGDKINPKGNATRAQAAKMLVVLYDACGARR